MNKIYSYIFNNEAELYTIVIRMETIDNKSI